MTLNSLLQRLYLATQNGMKLGLGNIKKLNELLNDPIGSYSTIHIAGTNGKGSVSTKLAKASELSGKKTGLYTSPHISSFTERIQIDGRPISHEKLALYLRQLFDLIDRHKIPATFFEISTALAFKYFADEGCEMAVFEAGMGGRWDATNIITPRFCVITSISLDHTEYLGPTLEMITYEKAGIIKKNCPVIIGPKVSKQWIEQHSSEVYQVSGEYGNYQAENNAIAGKAMDLMGISPDIRTEALKAMPPCRMEKHQYNHIPVILDVGHNEDGLAYLFKGLKQEYPDHRILCVYGLSKNKDIKQCLSIINRYASSHYLVEAVNGRGLPVNELKENCLSLGVNSAEIFVYEGIEPSVRQALADCRKNDLLLICGTFFIMASAKKALGAALIEDPCDLNEKVK